MFRVSITPIIRSAQNCNYSLRYCAVICLQRGQARLTKLDGGSCHYPASSLYMFRVSIHPSSGVHKTVTTASGTVQLPPSNVTKLASPRWREVAAIILQVHSTCFGCQLHPSSGVHKTVTTASGTVQLPPSNVVSLAWPRWRQNTAQYRRLQLQFCTLLMMGVVDTRNMCSELAE